jgi:hypothetical protein
MTQNADRFLIFLEEPPHETDLQQGLALASLHHQQNRKVPTLIGRQYIVPQFLGSKAELGKADANLGASLH